MPSFRPRQWQCHISPDPQSLSPAAIFSSFTLLLLIQAAYVQHLLASFPALPSRIAGLLLPSSQQTWCRLPFFDRATSSILLFPNRCEPACMLICHFPKGLRRSLLLLPWFSCSGPSLRIGNTHARDFLCMLDTELSTVTSVWLLLQIDCCLGGEDVALCRHRQSDAPDQQKSQFVSRIIVSAPITRYAQRNRCNHRRTFAPCFPSANDSS